MLERIVMGEFLLSISRKKRYWEYAGSGTREELFGIGKLSGLGNTKGRLSETRLIGFDFDLKLSPLLWSKTS